MITTMLRGTVARLKVDKGYGFVRSDDGREFFFHRSDLLDMLDFEQLREGQAMTFEEAQSTKGLRAKALRPA